MAQALALRTHRFHVGKLDFTRISAEAGAIAINGVALLLLLAPLSVHVPQAEEPVITTLYPVIEKKLPPLPPRPPRPVPVTTPRVVPTSPAVLPEKIEIEPPVVDSQPGDTFVEPMLIADASIDRGSAITEPLAGAHLEYESAPAPSYPIEAIRKALTGTVTLRVLVDVDGRPIDVQIDRSSGHRVLDAAAKKQVLAKWRFRPAMRDGHAVQAIGMVPVVFNLDR
jgi:periplasmic protein TonB